MYGAVGAAVTGGAGARTGAISRGFMLDFWEGKNEAGSWFFLDDSHWEISIKNYSSSTHNWLSEDELHKK